METELVKVLQLKYPTISYTNKLYEGNKKTLLTQTLHHKTLKLLPKIKIFFSTVAGCKLRFAQEIIAKLLCDDNSNAEIWLNLSTMTYFSDVISQGLSKY